MSLRSEAIPESLCVQASLWYCQIAPLGPTVTNEVALVIATPLKSTADSKEMFCHVSLPTARR